MSVCTRQALACTPAPSVALIALTLSLYLTVRAQAQEPKPPPEAQATPNLESEPTPSGVTSPEPTALTPPEPPFFSLMGVARSVTGWANRLNGVQVSYSMSASQVSASANEGSFTKGLVAQGSAETRSLSLSFYRHPNPGWSWTTDGGAGYLFSGIRDFEAPKLEQPARAGSRYVDVQCQALPSDSSLLSDFQSCDLSNRYQLTLISASFGLWGGYYKPLTFTDRLKGHLKAGLSWQPLNLRWVRATLGEHVISDGLSWSWLGVVKAGVLLRLFLLERLGLGLSFDLEWTPSIPFDDALEFRGARACDTQSCQRERVFVDQLSILSPSFGFHALWLWSL